jgi:hypothetical protein
MADMDKLDDEVKDEIDCTAPLAKCDVNPLKRAMAYNMVEGAIVSPSCTLCSSEYRSEAERMHREGRALSEIQTFLRGHDLDLSSSTIQRHMRDHYANLERVATVLEYCERIDDLRRHRRARFDDLDSLLQSGFIELANAIGMDTRGNMDRERIRSDQILRIKDDIRKTMAMMNDLEKQEDVIMGLKQRVAKACKFVSENAREEDKDTFVKAFREFGRAMESME